MAQNAGFRLWLFLYIFRQWLLGGHDDRLRQAVEDEAARERSRPGDAAHICPELWGVTDAGAGRYVACGGLTL